MKPRLGVNIDHVATLRQARGEDYPSVVQAADTSLRSGADQITIHLREDRRHIQDTDVEAVQLVTKKHGKPLNLEMGCNDEIIDIAIATNPDWICLVPEKREEKTTEGGLDLKGENFKRVLSTCELFKDKIPQTKISLFVESDIDTLSQCIKIPIDAVEIHTGDYAISYLNNESVEKYLKNYQEAYDFLKDKKIGFHAGHGLTDQSVVPLLKDKLFAEYNIGHWIICQSVFDGLGNVVKNLNDEFKNYPLN